VFVDVFRAIQALLVPPGLLLVLLVVALILAATGRRRGAVAVAVTGCAAVLALSLSPVSDLLLRPIEGRYEPLDPVAARSFAAEAIVLLGGGVASDAPAGEGQDLPDRAGTARALAAARLQRSLSLPVIASGGRAASDRTRQSRAEAAARLLVDLGVPAGSVLSETESRTTWESALKVRDAWGPRRVVLVTSAYHMPRAAACFERLGIAVLAAPTDYLSTASSSFLDWLPSPVALSASCTALGEYAAIAGYRALYGRAKASRDPRN
jgi:uncharacterized SAM-binding protein YcdF (DUF218 family)